MYGGICPCLSPECGCRSGSTNICLDFCNNSESTLSFLPIWKRELILKKRLNNGVGSVNVHPGIWHAVFFFRLVHVCPEESPPLALLCPKEKISRERPLTPLSIHIPFLAADSSFLLSNPCLASCIRILYLRSSSVLLWTLH